MEKLRINPNLVVVQGYCNGLLIDTERNSFYIVPLSMAILLSTSKIFNLRDGFESINLDLEIGEYEILAEYYQFLLEHDLAFLTSNPNLYSQLNLQWDYPGEISNCVIEFDDFELNLRDVFFQLEKLGCQYIQLIFFRTCSIIEILELIEIIDNSIVECITIILPYESISFKEVLNNDRIMSNTRLQSVLVYNCLNNEEIDLPEKMTVINSNISNSSCGVIHSSYFTPNRDAVSEGINYNSCLNRKISIDAEGNIKNCPSMKESYGNIMDTTLAEAIEKPGFKKYWDINKDKIHVCKDCEFRYVCTDCRAYVEDPEDIHSKPLKCGYNPYTGEWSEWSTNPLKQKAIDFYGMREMVEEMGGGDSSTEATQADLQ